MQRTESKRLTAKRLTCEALEYRRLLATFSVTSLLDGSPGSFRDAILQANANPGEDTVEIDASLLGGTSFLNGPQVPVTESVILHGSNVFGDHVIHANGGRGILDIQGTPGMSVTIRDLTFDGSIHDPDTNPETFPGQIESNDANLTLDGVSIINTVQPPTYVTNRPSALVARGNDVEISINDSFFLYNSGGAQLANRNAVFLTATGDSTISITNSVISQSSGSASGLRTYLHDQSDLTISGTQVVNNSYGGAYLFLDNQATATITSSAFAANQAYAPGLRFFAGTSSVIHLRESVVTGNLNGGISGGIQEDAKFYADDVLIQDNYSRYSGGGLGLHLSNNGTAVLNQVRMFGNYAYGDGGGVTATVSDNAQFVLSGSTISGNTAQKDAGGIDIRCVYTSYCHVSNSLISDNSAGMSGGGVYAELSYGGAAEITNSTISGNTAGTVGGGVYLYSLNGQALGLSYSTVTNNQSSYSGGGLFSYFQSFQSIVAMNSIVAGNLAASSPDTQASFNTNLSRFNLIGVGSGGNLVDQVMGNLVGTVSFPIDPLLGPLADNGGMSLTHALLAASPARNAGDPNASSPPRFDQRGLPFVRVDFARIDMGAYEAQSMVSPDFDNNGVLDCDDINALGAAILNPPPSIAMFDLNADGELNLADIDVWLDVAGNLTIGSAYLPGDANLDGFVDGQDFLIWNGNKFTSSDAWCSGDFNADGIVDGQDFLIWNAFKFQSSVRSADPQLTDRLRKRPAERDPSIPFDPMRYLECSTNTSMKGASQETTLGTHTAIPVGSSRFL